MRISYPILVFLFLSQFTFGQESTKNYFQQEVNFNIEVELLDKTQAISAFETIEYTNNSTKTLDTIYFHIWPNAYKNLETGYGKEKIDSKDKEYVLNQKIYRGYIDSLDFKVNGIKVDFYLHKESEDILYVILNNSLLAGETITISTPFYVKIPRSHSRLGYAEQSFQITQWYPKPAVFDLGGWHYFPYRDQGEFYSEFGSYNVEITAPENYTIAATGNLMNTQSEENIKTYTYSENNIHDFAWFADINLKIDIDSVQLPYSNRWVKTISYYNPSSSLWKEANQYIKDAVYYYSLWLGDYPYKTCKAIQSELGAGGGMEYPTITVIGTGNNPFDLESVIMHEVGHNWFYGILGSNEREHPWMDEGINSAYESRYLETKYPNKLDGLPNIDKYSLKHTKADYYAYLLSASRNSDQAGNLNSEQYKMINYGTIVYKKDAAIINYLRHYLGDEEFDRIMKIYFETWKFKHPQPNDFKNVFAENSSKNLSWFFDDLLSSKSKTDYKIKSLKKRDNYSELQIKNTRKIHPPLFIQLYQQDSLVKEIISEGFKNDSTYQLEEIFDKIYIDYNFRSIDFNRNNNFVKSKGLFRKNEKLSFEFIGAKPEAHKTQIYYSPIMGYNTTNEFMFGAAFFSNWAFPNQFEYFIMPMYSFGNEQVSGETYFSYHIESNNNFIKQVSPYISTKTYGLSNTQNYFQIQAGVDIDIQHFLVSHPTKQNLKFYYIASSQYFDANKFNQFINIEYTAKNKRWYNPFSFKSKLTINEEFALISADIKQELTYSKPHTGLKVRFFAGAFLFNNSNNGQYNLSLSGTSGIYDYAYEESFIGRNDSYEQFWAHQFIANEGGFSTYAPFSSHQWMSSITISSTLPIKTPLEFYFTLAAFEGSNQFFDDGIAWESGLAINVIRDMAIIYLPFSFLTHEQINETNALYTEQYIERVRFTLLLNEWNIRKLARNIDDFF